MRTAAASGFEQTLIPISACINDLKARSVPADNEQLKQLEANLNDLTQRRDQALQIYDTQLTQIDSQRNSSIEQIKAQIMQQ
ncbi:hypothetical protein [Paenibacillus sp. W2I17]|uniref:hypothetical protein n=1 Tax=Paenibacillus sp. W2I17 TaxID=3042311 RepID=UPI002781D3CC|nr:hypothetical protein [Paenibacillus sp. W2I17]MDQ0655985.1 hypothetical protein [Paenibacillus sp. W2I17]